jgi:hypothetical protein
MQTEAQLCLNARLTGTRERIVLRNIQGIDGGRSLVRLKTQDVVIVCGDEGDRGFVPVHKPDGKLFYLHTIDLSESTKPLSREP